LPLTLDALTITYCTRLLLDLLHQASAGEIVEKSRPPHVILKELIENSLDPCEEAGVAPVIDVEVSDDGVAVTDNGPGIAPDTVANILDYTSRTSRRLLACPQSYVETRRNIIRPAWQARSRQNRLARRFRFPPRRSRGLE
jgi:hypothetical protein